MKRRVPSRVTVFDVILMAVILSSAALALQRVWQGGADRLVADIYVRGRLIEARPLDTDGVFPVGDGTMVTIEVKDGRVRVAESDCPRRTCARMGWASRAGQTIVCVPNRLLIQIRGDRQDVDAETY